MSLDRLKLHLLFTLHHGSFQPDHYLLPWMSNGVAELLLERGRELRPRRVVYDEGVKYKCHENALRYAVTHEGVQAFFGFGLYDDERWWLHSICLGGDGTVIDSAPPTPPTPWKFFGVPWSQELFRLVAPRYEGTLPEVFTRAGNNLTPICERGYRAALYLYPPVAPTTLVIGGSGVDRKENGT